jgi:hypothetical protein
MCVQKPDEPIRPSIPVRVVEHDYVTINTLWINKSCTIFASKYNNVFGSF